jgi:hypothetical protein
MLKRTLPFFSLQERTDAEEKLLDAVWREAKSLRKWVVQEKQRIANEISEKLKEEQEKIAVGSQSSSSSTSAPEESAIASEKVAPAPEKERMVDRTTYEYFRDTLVSKLRVLLRVCPAFTHHDPAAFTALLSAITGTLLPLML